MFVILLALRAAKIDPQDTRLFIPIVICIHGKAVSRQENELVEMLLLLLPPPTYRDRKERKASKKRKRGEYRQGKKEKRINEDKEGKKSKLSTFFPGLDFNANLFSLPMILSLNSAEQSNCGGRA